MLSRTSRTVLGALAAVLLGTAANAAPDELTILAPAGPGGGWDQTARSIQQVLQETGIVPSVQVVNVPGAGGTIGLAQFANQRRGDPAHLIVGGYVMVGAIIANDAPVTLEEVTPIARLTGEYVGIVVPAASEIESMEQLVEQLKADPGAVTWAGGSAGGVDHILVGLIAEAADVDPAAINYIPYSGGGEALAAILGGQVTAGVSGLSEFAGQIAAGDLRLLGVSSPERLDGFDAPTLQESGLDIDVQNWRMVAAAPGITDEDRAELIATIEEMANSQAWQDLLAQRGWENTFLVGDDFAEYLDGEIESTGEVLRSLGITQ